METLHTWWATELYPMRERDQFGVSGEFEVVLATDAQATIAALQARVQELEDGTSALLNQQSERLAVENEKLMMALSQLTQRTAELETIRRVLDEKADCADLWYDEFLRIRALNASQEINGICDRALDGITRNVPVVKENHELHSELERVRDQYADLRKMVLALPKVEGEIRVIEVATDEWHVYDTIFATKAGADNYAALLQHRQGMEG